MFLRTKTRLYSRVLLNIVFFYKSLTKYRYIINHILCFVNSYFKQKYFLQAAPARNVLDIAVFIRHIFFRINNYRIIVIIQKARPL